MAYFLQVKDLNDNYKTIGIEKTDICRNDNFNKGSYTKLGAFDLNQIDKFTSLFKDEYELKNYLISCNLLDKHLYNQPLNINFYKKNKIQYMYNLLYQDSLLYFLNPDDLINFLENNGLNNDFDFIKSLSKYFYSLSGDKVMAAKLYSMADKYIVENNNLDNEFCCLVKIFFKMIIYKYKKDNSDNFIFLNEVNWRTFHLFIEFVNNYKITSKCKIKKK